MHKTFIMLYIEYGMVWKFFETKANQDVHSVALHGVFWNADSSTEVDRKLK